MDWLWFVANQAILNLVWELKPSKCLQNKEKLVQWGISTFITNDEY